MLFSVAVALRRPPPRFPKKIFDTNKACVRTFSGTRAPDVAKKAACLANEPSQLLRAPVPPPAFRPALFPKRHGPQASIRTKAETPPAYRSTRMEHAANRTRLTARNTASDFSPVRYARTACFT